MDSVVVHLRDVTEKQVTEFLQCAYPFQHGPPWIDAVSGDAALFINLYSNASVECEPEQPAKVVAALGVEPCRRPSVAVGFRICATALLVTGWVLSSAFHIPA